MINLEEITIAEYCKLLKEYKNIAKCKEIDTELSKSISGLGNGMDLSIFMLQKDLLISQCKLAMAILDRDPIKIKIYEGRVNKFLEQVESKKKKNDGKKSTPYKVFTSWLISVEDYRGFPFDRKCDLLYFSEATNKMLNSYESQKQNAEQQKGKRK